MLRLVLLIKSPAESERVSGFRSAMNHITKVKRVKDINKANKLATEGWKFIDVTSYAGKFIFLMGYPGRLSSKVTLAEVDPPDLRQSQCESEHPIHQGLSPS